MPEMKMNMLTVRVVVILMVESSRDVWPQAFFKVSERPSRLAGGGTRCSFLLTRREVNPIDIGGNNSTSSTLQDKDQQKEYCNLIANTAGESIEDSYLLRDKFISPGDGVVLLMSKLV